MMLQWPTWTFTDWPLGDIPTITQAIVVILVIAIFIIEIYRLWRCDNWCRKKRRATSE